MGITKFLPYLLLHTLPKDKNNGNNPTATKKCKCGKCNKNAWELESY